MPPNSPEFTTWPGIWAASPRTSTDDECVVNGCQRKDPTSLSGNISSRKDGCGNFRRQVKSVHNAVTGNVFVEEVIPIARLACQEVEVIADYRQV